MDSSTSFSEEDDCIEDFIDRTMSPDVASALNASAELFENFCMTLEELYGQKYSVRREEDVDSAHSTFCWTLKLEIPGGIQLTKPFYISFTTVEVKEVVSCVLDYMGV